MEKNTFTSIGLKTIAKQRLKEIAHHERQNLYLCLEGIIEEKHKKIL